MTAMVQCPICGVHYQLLHVAHTCGQTKYMYFGPPPDYFSPPPIPLTRADLAAAFQRGAEAMRADCADVPEDLATHQREAIRALPLPEYTP